MKNFIVKNVLKFTRTQTTTDTWSSVCDGWNKPQEVKKSERGVVPSDHAPHHYFQAHSFVSSIHLCNVRRYL